MAFQLRKRSACDRCHSQKLRCPKQVGSVACARCVKAGARCVYSPPSTSIVPVDVDVTNITSMDGVVVMDGGDMTTTQTSSFTDGFHFGVWTGSESDSEAIIDFNPFLPQPNLDTNGTHADSNLYGLSETDPTQLRGVNHDDEVQCPRSVCTQNLTSLLHDADRVWARFPPQSTLHMPRNQADDLFQKLLSEKAATKSLLENFFTLAQRLIDTYPAAISAAIPPTNLSSREPAPASPSSPCDITDCMHTFELGPPLRELEAQILSLPSGRVEAEDGTLVGPDLALANLLVACHTRLLDILDRVFLLVAACTRVTLACRREPCFDVSYLRVGTFVPPRTAAVLMQIALLKHMTAGLGGQLASFGRAIVSSSAGGGAGRPEGEVLRLQHELLAGRHAQKVAQVGVVEEFLVTFEPPGA